MSKEQAQAVLAQYAMTPSGKKPKRTEGHKWTQDVTSAEFRKWQSEQQKNNPQYKQKSSVSLPMTSPARGVARESGVRIATTRRSLMEADVD